jgi:hypothetical protein
MAQSGCVVVGEEQISRKSMTVSPNSIPTLRIASLKTIRAVEMTI